MKLSSNEPTTHIVTIITIIDTPEFRKMLAVVAQLGLIIYFGTLIGVLTKAPWVYPYSWHPICMGLYGFVATEGKFTSIIPQLNKR